MRVVFMGTPEFAVCSLRALARDHDVALVVTRPDAVRGRGKKLVPSPVKAAAMELGLPVLEAYRLGTDEIDRISEERPDVVCVAAYGALLPDKVLEIAPHGCVNVHASLLPHGRGAAPIQRAVLEGDEFAGVSIMRIVHDLDAGPYCRQARVEVADMSCQQLMAKLAEVGARELLLALEEMTDGRDQWVDQDESAVTYAAKISKAEMLLDPEQDSQTNLRRVRASLDAAPARLMVEGKGVRAMEACSCEEAVSQGSVKVQKGRVLLGCSDGTLELLRLKPDGKREMDARSWSSGLRGDSFSWAKA